MLRAIVFFVPIALFATRIPVLADTLVSGSVYFDSQKTLEEVVKLSADKDNESILKLINNGHVSRQTDTDKDIVVIASGLTPESPAEFRFLSGPTTYWTLTKFINKSVEPTPTPTPERSLSLTAQRKDGESESDAPSDDDNGRRIWHKVGGKWKWYPANKRSVPVKKALPPD
jgi:hypothetical protein